MPGAVDYELQRMWYCCWACVQSARRATDTGIRQTSFGRIIYLTAPREKRRAYLVANVFCTTVTGIYDTVVSPNMLAAGSSYATRGHDFRLQKIRARHDLRKYYFTNTVVNIRNSPSSYVVSAKSVNCFKNRLYNFYNFWKDQEIIYNFRAEIYGTRNRSEVTVW